MKKSLLKAFSLIVVIALCFSAFSAIGVSAETKLPEKYTILDGEVYSFREVYDQVITGLDATAKDEAYFDGYDWFINTQEVERRNDTFVPWGVKELFCYRTTSSADYNALCISGAVDFNLFKAMIAHNVKDINDKKLYWGFADGWSNCDLETWINFTAPQSGSIVIFEEMGNAINALPADSPFWSFEDRFDLSFNVSILKNDVKIWPTDGSEGLVIDKNNRSVAFPDAGEIKVTTGDVISIYVRSYKPNGGHGSVTMNPAVGYTEIVEDEPEIEDEFEDETDTDTDTDTDADNKNDGPSIFLIIGIGAGALVAIAAVAVIVILVIKKKKAKVITKADDTPAEADENPNE